MPPGVILSISCALSPFLRAILLLLILLSNTMCNTHVPYYYYYYYYYYYHAVYKYLLRSQEELDPKAESDSEVAKTGVYLQHYDQEPE